MPFYTVMIPPPGSGGPREEIEKARLLPDRFSWAGLTFTLLWLLGKRLWLASLIVGLIYGLLIQASLRFGLQNGAFLLAHVAIGLFVGLEGHNLIGRKLARKGWRLADVVEARTLAEAERRYFERALAQQQPAAAALPPGPMRPKSGPVPIIGLFPEASRR